MADDEQGLASGLVNTGVRIGGAVVLAVISAILGNAAVGVAASLATLVGLGRSNATVEMVPELVAEPHPERP